MAQSLPVFPITMKDYLGDTFTVTHKLIYNGKIVGFRLNLKGVIYDIEYTDFDMFINSHNDNVYEGYQKTHLGISNDFMSYEVTSLPTLNFVELNGILTCPNDDKEYPELNYDELCFLTGTFFTPQVKDVKRLYDDINKNVFEGVLPSRVIFKWNTRSKTGATIITERKLQLKGSKLDGSDTLTMVELPHDHYESYLYLSRDSHQEFMQKMMYTVLTAIKDKNFPYCDTLSPNASSSLGFQIAFRRYLDASPNVKGVRPVVNFKNIHPDSVKFSPIKTKRLAERKYEIPGFLGSSSK